MIPIVYKITNFSLYLYYYILAKNGQFDSIDYKSKMYSYHVAKKFKK